MDIHQIGVRVQYQGVEGVIMDGGACVPADYVVQLDNGEVIDVVHYEVVPVPGDPSRLVQYTSADEYSPERWYLFYYQPNRGPDEVCEGDYCDGHAKSPERYASIAFEDADCLNDCYALPSQESLLYCKECMLQMVLDPNYDNVWSAR